MHRKSNGEIEQWVLRELCVSERVRSLEICVLARERRWPLTFEKGLVGNG
jgi:hypothetical protein